MLVWAYKKYIKIKYSDLVIFANSLITKSEL